MNDVTALRGDPALAGVVADAECYLCLMHMQGEPRTMQAGPGATTTSRPRWRRSSRSGCASRSRPGSTRSGSASIPGIGFGKTVEQNLELVSRLDVLAAPRSPGADRPLAQELARPAPRRSRARAPGSLSASLAAAVAAYERGATILRVHDVKEHVEALTVARAIA